MTRIGVVIHQPLRTQLFSAADAARLESLGTVQWTESDEPLSVAEAIEVLHDCDIGIGSWRTPNIGSPELLAACPKLRLWEHVAGSVKNMFGPHLSGSNLTIASCKTAIAECVAEFTLAQLILGIRGFFPNAAANRSGRSGKPRGGVLYGAVIGVIGASEVGRRVIRNLRPFGCRILLFDPCITPAAAQDLGAEKYDSLVAMAAECDALSLHTPLLDSTHKLVSAAVLAALPDHAVFINTSRGPCVDQDALTAELQRGRLLACLDVTEPEPLPDDHILRRLENCIITSHIAGPATINMGAQCVDDVARFLRGESPQAVITQEMLATTA